MIKKNKKRRELSGLLTVDVGKKIQNSLDKLQKKTRIYLFILLEQKIFNLIFIRDSDISSNTFHLRVQFFGWGLCHCVRWNSLVGLHHPKTYCPLLTLLLQYGIMLSNNNNNKQERTLSIFLFRSLKCLISSLFI